MSPVQVSSDPTASSASTDLEDVGSEEMLRLVQRLFLSGSVNVSRQVVFCGVGSESGSTSVCAGAGRTLASHSSHTVCLVDANLRSSRLSGLFGFQRESAYPRSSAPSEDICALIDRNLWLARPGVLAADGGALPSSARLQEILAGLRDRFDFVLIDAPGADISGDAALLGQVADGTVLVIDADRTRKTSARKAKESLDAAGVRILGTVLHNRSFPIPKGIYEKL